MRYTTKYWNRVSNKRGTLRQDYISNGGPTPSTVRKHIRSRTEQWWILSKLFDMYSTELLGEYVPLMEAFARNQEPDTIAVLREEFIAIAKTKIAPELVDAAITNAENMIVLGFRV